MSKPPQFRTDVGGDFRGGFHLRLSKHLNLPGLRVEVPCTLEAEPMDRVVYVTLRVVTEDS